MSESSRRKQIEIRRSIEIKGFFNCNNCAGYGYIYAQDKQGYYITYQEKKLPVKCYQCNGDGKISWLQEIFKGVK